MMVSLNDIHYFMEVAQTLNISRAAERLGVGQPAVSQAVRRLESHYRVQLFDRYKTGVQLTSAGKTLYENGEGALQSFERLQRLVLDSKHEVAGNYTVGCHTSVAHFTLPLFTKSLLQSYPGISLRLRHGLSREILSAVVNFEIDLGLVINPVRHPDLVIKTLCTDQVCFWQADKGLSDTLIFDPHLLQTQSLLEKIKDLNFARHIETTDLEVAARLAESGAGVAILPSRVASNFSGLKKMDKRFPEYKDTLCLVYRSDKLKSEGIKVIIDFIRKIKF